MMSFERYKRFKHYLNVRRDVLAMSDADLQDAGLKRYQLGHVARVQALK
jgi:uncharacterized protein YjiS (DUF1127 family)